MKLGKMIKRAVSSASKAVKKATTPSGPLKQAMDVRKAALSAPKNIAQKIGENLGSKTAGKVMANARPSLSSGEESTAPNLMKKAAKKIGSMRFKDGGMADKTGRAMKKTDADAKGRAMSKKAPKKMMGGGMMKGYAEGGDVTCGKATRGYGAARKGK